jgi:hydrogenase maturation protein HypF
MKQIPLRERREVLVRGIVQGVGFRPFIYALAQRHALAGWVRNDAEGVCIQVEGVTEDLDRFLCGIAAEAPPLAVVETVVWRPCVVQDERGFRIEESREGDQRHALVCPDVATCADCLRELFAPKDRRYRYPFINCTNCGPRFTITRSVPYDRAVTTMAGFTMCPACRHEYEDPADRRFHAQPNACPICGPHVRLLDSAQQEIIGDEALRTAAERLRRGAILAVKGLGGYHLACNPFDADAVAALRARKVRQDKPFALMARTLDEVRTLCRLETEEEALLMSAARPIVLLERRADSGVADEIAPRQRRLGIMLAYTPLHHLLLHDVGIPLVMTSGNRSDEPIAYRDDEAFEQLGGIADAFLTHDRPIHMRCDDSVVQMAGVRRWALGVRSGNAQLSANPPMVTPSATSQEPMISEKPCPTPNAQRPTPTFVRRSRGYAPAPLRVTSRFGKHLLACGGEMKNTFCLAKEDHVFLSPHIGDLENYETLRSFREGIEHYGRLFDARPERVAYDLHPDYLSTQYARELEAAGMPAVGVQHHHAHIAACLADNSRPDTERVIGVALDGTGYGTDGAIWGGEFLAGSIAEGFARRAHLEYLPMPGGAAAIRQPWRMALAQLIRLYGEEEALRLPLPPVEWAGERNARLIARLLEHNLNTPQTSSAGRLFDAVAALVGVPGSRHTTYEGQAAVELELAAFGVETPGSGYPFRLRAEGEIRIVETDRILTGVAEDRLAGRPVGEIASRFHLTMAEIVIEVCLQLQGDKAANESSLCAVALSGGTFQNALLLELVEERLVRQGFTVYRHRRVPTNDGGLCLGQAVLANRLFENQK